MAVLAAMASLPSDTHAAALPGPAAAASTMGLVRRADRDWWSYSSGPPSLISDVSSASDRSTRVVNQRGANTQLNGLATVFAHTIYNHAQANANDGVYRVVQTVRDQYLAQPVADFNIRRTYWALFNALLQRISTIHDSNAALHYAIAYITHIHMDADENNDEMGNGYLNSAINALVVAGNMLWLDFDQRYDEFEDRAERDMGADLQRIA
ncbi:hypothetical protein H4R34_003179 [Dimargaris verticillata]|uniref:Uncharacterized protein n=1 Tax=Dimargaris verticillata TaxID=2761393 RepID=A0A9W8ECW1_9FUNG|nr:hypothetical protein H4R34_003179 [Dimargaris verticillata]